MNKSLKNIIDIFIGHITSPAPHPSTPEAHSEPCQASKVKRFAKIVNNYNYFRKL